MERDLAIALKELRDGQNETIQRLTVVETKSDLTKEVMDAFVSKTTKNSIELGKIQTHQKYSFFIFTSFFGAAWTAMAVWFNRFK